ncbi:MAG: 3-dehydroquinate synthase [Acidimicrobiia bacterium]|nr:3-dehydroquinate synthase [Acidimicrobiia bacterium]
METVESILIGEECEILVSEGLPVPLLPPRPRTPRSKVVVVTQPGAAARVGDAAVSRIAEDASETEADPVAVHTVRIPDREEAKTLRVVEDVYRELDRHRVDRHDTIVGVGGGAATDLAGFVAATWLRGVEAVYVPTTLLGAVDAAIGGKTGVNREGKNQVGVFRHPRRVAISVEVLRSLPRPLLVEGMGEALKAGLIADPRLVEVLESDGLGASLTEVVTRAVRVKAEVTAGDFFETGRRAILNYGHTVGHAVETATGIPHGHAVAVGMVAAGAISARKTGFAHAERQREVIASLGLPVRSPEAPRPVIMDLVGRDKKRLGGSLPKMVLLEDFGKPVVVDVTLDDLEVGLTAVGL